MLKFGLGWLITLTETLIIPYTPETESNNCFIMQCIARNGGHVFVLHWGQAAFIMITLRNHAPRSYMTCYLWPWVSLTWLLYNLQLDDVTVTWSQRLSFILYWQILGRESLLIFFLLARSAESREKKASGRDRWEPHFHAISFWPSFLIGGHF